MARLLAGFLIAVAVTGLLVGALSVGIDRGVLDEERIGVLAGELTREPEVQEDVARRIVRTAVKRIPEVRPFRRPLKQGIEAAVDSDGFRSIFAAAARRAFRTIDRDEGVAITLDLDRVWTVLPASPVFRPVAERAAALEGSATVELFKGKRVERARRIVDLPQRLGWAGLAVGGLAAILAIALAGPRARRMILLGGLLLGMAAVLLVTLPILVDLAASGLDSPGDAVAHVVWDVAGRSIRTWVAGVMVGGLVALVAGALIARSSARAGGRVRIAGGV